MNNIEPKRGETIFWIEVSSIRPNSQQPRKDFDEDKLLELAESIKQYGILQPLLVVRIERDVPSGTEVVYELIAGERRWRAAQIAGLTQVPVIIRKEPPEKIKLELALIENIQRANLNPIERARAFRQLADEFGLMHHEIAKRVGKSRMYVTNVLRLLNLPQEIIDAISEGKLTEGHGKSLLMLSKKPEEQKLVFEDVLRRGMSTYETEKIARRIAYERARKQEGLHFYEQMRELEKRLTNLLGTTVIIDRKGNMGKISINFSSENELENIFELISTAKEKSVFENIESDSLSETNSPTLEKFGNGDSEISETEFPKKEMSFESEPKLRFPEEINIPNKEAVTPTEIPETINESSQQKNANPFSSLPVDGKSAEKDESAQNSEKDFEDLDSFTI